jgi:putative membrane protein
MNEHRVPATCLVVFLAVWTAMAVAPRYPEDWFLENLPTFVFVPIAVLSYRRFRFSDAAYVQATLFAVLHTIGSHYTYSEVPLGDWVRDAFDLSRNHYDRFVHFSFGLLMLRPLCELALPAAAAVGLRSAYLGLSLVAFWSALYEIVEWAVASIADPGAGTAYLGTQGDVWDAQKDVALAWGGALAALLIEAALRNRASGRRGTTEGST